MLKPDVNTALLSLLVTAFALPWQPLAVLVVLGGMIIGSVAVRSAWREPAMRAVRRLRWLLISLLVLALFFTPGEPVFRQFASLSPSWNGVVLMVERGLLLVTLALLATIFLVSYTAAEIVAAIQRLLRFLPDRYSSRIATRIYLVLEEFPSVEARVRAARRETSRAERGRDTGFVAAASGVIVEIEGGDLASSAAPASDNKEPRAMGSPEEVPGRMTLRITMESLIMPILLLVFFIFMASGRS